MKKILYLLALVLFFVLAYMAYDFYSFTSERNKAVQTKGLETSLHLRKQVNDILTKIATEGERLAQLFGSNDYTPEEIEKIIKNSALSIQEIQGVTACYEPNAFSSSKRLYCPYYDKGSRSYIQVEDSYDYTVIGKGTAWYTGVRDNGAKWVEPYFAKAAQDWYVDYGIPFYFNNGPKKGKIRGTITMSFVCSGFNELVHNMSLGKTGFGVITSPGGTFLAHPTDEYIGTTHIDSIIKKETDPNLAASFESISKGETGSTSFLDKKTGEKILFYFDKIPISDWGVGLLFYKKDLLGDATQLNHRYIKIALVFSAFLLILIAIYFNKDFLDKREIWILSLLASTLLVANIVLIAYLQHNTIQPHPEHESPPITSMAVLNSFVNKQHHRADELKIVKSRPVPTGIYVQRMEFEDSYNLNVGGTIWQKYPSEIADSVKIGFSLPQISPFAEASYIEETYRKKIASKEGEQGYLLVGWDFRVTLRLDFEYSNFPLDKRHISIKILPLDNNDHLVFTPDLMSYNYTNPSKKSGLNKKIKISGSEVLESYFNYSIESYDVNFGYNSKEMFEKVPVLHYNVQLRRMLLNAFITYLIPIAVVLLMLFFLINTTTKSEESQGIIESMAAFAFVLVFSHIDMRKEIVTADLIYIEFFYFATYLLIVWTTFNLLTYAKAKHSIFDFYDNLISKATFFPIFYILILFITLYKFY